MSNTYPKVSVIMTLYNKGGYVEEAIRSVLQGTFTDLELLVVDDASTDEGLQRVNEFSDPRVIVLHSTVNTGRAAAANRGMAAARGEYIALLDADDVAHPDRLSEQVAFLDGHREVGVLGTGYTVLGDPSRVALWPEQDEQCRAGLLFGDPVVYGTAMFRRSIMVEQGLRCRAEWRTPGMDYLFICSFALHTRYANLPRPLLQYRMGENNMRHGRDPVEDKARIITGIFQALGLSLSPAQLELQLWLQGYGRTAIDADLVRRLYQWMQDLTDLVRERGMFPEEPFRSELQRRWMRLFHKFADADLGAALVHSRLSRAWPKDRMSYLARTTINRWVQRKP